MGTTAWTRRRVVKEAKTSFNSARNYQRFNYVVYGLPKCESTVGKLLQTSWECKSEWNMSDTFKEYFDILGIFLINFLKES